MAQTSGRSYFFPENPSNLSAKNCKLLSFRGFSQNLAISSSFCVMSSSFVAVEKNHTVKKTLPYLTFFCFLVALLASNFLSIYPCSFLIIRLVDELTRWRENCVYKVLLFLMTRRCKRSHPFSDTKVKNYI